MTDQESRFLAARSPANYTSKAVIEAFHCGWVVPFGEPSKVTTDNAPEFASPAWANFCRSIGIKHFSSKYNLQGNVDETGVKKLKVRLLILSAS